jgi:hypothetical protein
MRAFCAANVFVASTFSTFSTRSVVSVGSVDSGGVLVYGVSVCPCV